MLVISIYCTVGTEIILLRKVFRIRVQDNRVEREKGRERYSPHPCIRQKKKGRARAGRTGRDRTGAEILVFG